MQHLQKKTIKKCLAGIVGGPGGGYRHDTFPRFMSGVEEWRL